MKCVQGKEVYVHKNAVGYYIGCDFCDEETDKKIPCCRISEYFTTRELANEALNNGFVPRVSVENEICSKGKKCIEGV